MCESAEKLIFVAERERRKSIFHHFHTFAKPYECSRIFRYAFGNQFSALETRNLLLFFRTGMQVRRIRLNGQIQTFAPDGEKIWILTKSGDIQEFHFEGVLEK